ncbi:unnamed protein product [Cladocopium goreaui]|uniref:Uncharacterized protein n=1 Tax=Cladocopium goreaui TaxID=2562237 RepID=A0A9P1BLC3_9DINO|nr:unnamed protein product [Cladocopium goreaui]
MTGQIMSRQDRQLASVDHGSGLASEAHGTRPSGLRTGTKEKGLSTQLMDSFDEEWQMADATRKGREKDLGLEPGQVAQFGKMSQRERWLEAFHGVPFAAIPIPEDSHAGCH